MSFSSEALTIIISTLTPFFTVVIAGLSTAIVNIRKAKVDTRLEIETLRSIINIFLNSKDFEEAKIIAKVELDRLDNKVTRKK